ncbi:hypothetical protein KM043_011107 [Ampulex compressa]|nr:hypothetical protein KM043_011107 [Ampulex compressa]
MFGEGTVTRNTRWYYPYHVIREATPTTLEYYQISSWPKRASRGMRLAHVFDAHTSGDSMLEFLGTSNKFNTARYSYHFERKNIRIARSSHRAARLFHERRESGRWQKRRGARLRRGEDDFFSRPPGTAPTVGYAPIFHGASFGNEFRDGVAADLRSAPDLEGRRPQTNCGKTIRPVRSAKADNKGERGGKRRRNGDKRESRDFFRDRGRTHAKEAPSTGDRFKHRRLLQETDGCPGGQSGAIF